METTTGLKQNVLYRLELCDSEWYNQPGIKLTTNIMIVKREATKKLWYFVANRNVIEFNNVYLYIEEAGIYFESLPTNVNNVGFGFKIFFDIVEQKFITFQSKSVEATEI